MGAPDPFARFEYRSRLHIGRLPLLHVVRGVDPSSGRRPPAVGVIAVGQIAVGVVAVGQLAVGVISVGQAAIGLGWGIGQAAFGLLAAGQVAAGALGAVGQVALGPAGLGVVRDGGFWVALGWAAGALYLFGAIARRRRRLAPLLAAPGAVSIRSVCDTGGWHGSAHVAAHVISPGRLHAPLSGRSCVFWHAVDVGSAGPAHHHAGAEITVADATGTARVDLGGPVIFIRSDDAHVRMLSDLSVRLETLLDEGDGIHVAGPVALASDREVGASSRGDVSPVFAGRPDAPLVVTTRNPAAVAAELRFAAALGWSFLAVGVLAGLRWLW